MNCRKTTAMLHQALVLSGTAQVRDSKSMDMPRTTAFFLSGMVSKPKLACRLGKTQENNNYVCYRCIVRGLGPEVDATRKIPNSAGTIENLFFVPVLLANTAATEGAFIRC